MKKTFLICFVIGIAVVYLYFLWQRQSVSVIQPPRESGSPYNFSLDEAPSDSIRGMVSSVSGQVLWTSRTATAPATLQPDTKLQQGETIATGDDSGLVMNFPGKADVSLASRTDVEIIQTLPQNFVFKQTAGSASYAIEDIPISVTARHLLAVAQKGSMRITFNEESGLISIKAIKGTVKLAYNSLDYQTMSLTLSEGETYTYDDVTRTGENE